MDRKIKNYVEFLFLDVPYSRKAEELKEEIVADMLLEYEKYLHEGKTENEAYSLVISSLENLDQLLIDVELNDEFRKQVTYYRRRNAINTALGVSMYIIGAAFLIGIGGFGEYTGNSDFYGLIGLLILLLISAAATGLIVYTHMSTPAEYKDYNERADHEFRYLDSKHSRLLTNVLSVYWTLITFIYLATSFVTGRWDITWIIWILGSVFYSILKTVFEMKYGAE